MEKKKTDQENPPFVGGQSSGPTAEQFARTLSEELKREQIEQGGRRMREDIIIAIQERKNRQERLKARAEGRPDPTDLPDPFALLDEL